MIEKKQGTGSGNHSREKSVWGVMQVCIHTYMPPPYPFFHRIFFRAGTLFHRKKLQKEPAGIYKNFRNRKKL